MKDGYREFFNNRFFHGDETALRLTYQQFFVTSQSRLLSIVTDKEKIKNKIFLTCTSEISPLLRGNVEREKKIICFDKYIKDRYIEILSFLSRFKYLCIF